MLSFEVDIVLLRYRQLYQFRATPSRDDRKIDGVLKRNYEAISHRYGEVTLLLFCVL
jgi:hypothetical protein